MDHGRTESQNVLIALAREKTLWCKECRKQLSPSCRNGKLTLLCEGNHSWEEDTVLGSFIRFTSVDLYDEAKAAFGSVDKFRQAIRPAVLRNYAAAQEDISAVTTTTAASTAPTPAPAVIATRTASTGSPSSACLQPP